MKFVKNEELKVLALFGLCSVLIVAFTFVLPISAAVAYDAVWAPVWVAITHSGSATGITVILLLASIVISLQVKSIKKRVIHGLIVFLLLSVAVGGTAFFNEFVIKERLKEFRPSISYLEKHADLNAKEFYLKHDKIERRNYLRNQLNLADGKSFYVDKKPMNQAVLKEWIRSAGYSFPSGHSVSAFLLVTLLGYYLLIRFKPAPAIGRQRLAGGDTRKSGKELWILGAFYLWAVLVAYSRVLIGVHSALDISVGALCGSMVGFALIYSGLLNRLWRNEAKQAE